MIQDIVSYNEEMMKFVGRIDDGMVHTQRY